MKGELVLYKDSGLTQSKQISTAKTLISFPEKEAIAEESTDTSFSFSCKT